MDMMGLAGLCFLAAQFHFLVPFICVLQVREPTWEERFQQVIRKPKPSALELQRFFQELTRQATSRGSSVDSWVGESFLKWQSSQGWPLIAQGSLRHFQEFDAFNGAHRDDQRFESDVGAICHAFTEHFEQDTAKNVSPVFFIHFLIKITQYWCGYVKGTLAVSKAKKVTVVAWTRLGSADFHAAATIAKAPADLLRLEGEVDARLQDRQLQTEDCQVRAVGRFLACDEGCFWGP